MSDVDLQRRLRDQSHGMKRKIGIVQALMGRAPVIILDEPTAGLDPLMIQAFRETLADLKRQGDTTVFLSSHVLAEVESTCDRIGVVRGGRMVTIGTVEELKRKAPRHVRVEFSSPVPAELPAVPGVTVRSSDVDRARVRRARAARAAAAGAGGVSASTTCRKSRSGSKTTSSSSTARVKAES